MNIIRIGSKLVGIGYPTFIVAEVSCNHQQNYEQAEAIVKAAAKAGADAVKLQTYTPDTMTIDSDKKWFLVGGIENPDTWRSKTFYQLYREAYTPWEWFPKLQTLTKSLGLEFFSSPFDATAVDFLENLGVPCYKVASYECTDIPLLKKIAETGKPVIMSIGFADFDEASYSIKYLKDQGVKDLIVLHCTTSYKATCNIDHTNLSTINDIIEKFDVVSGFSDNMGGIDIPIFAAFSGASVVEKHLVLKHDTAVLDDRFSLDPQEFKKMVDSIRTRAVPGDESWRKRVIGIPSYGCQTVAERESKRYRRSIFVVRDIKEGEIFTEKNIRCIRPSYGLEPRYYFDVLGKKAKEDIERGTPLSFCLVE